MVKPIDPTKKHLRLVLPSKTAQNSRQSFQQKFKATLFERPSQEEASALIDKFKKLIAPSSSDVDKKFDLFAIFWNFLCSMPQATEARELFKNYQRLGYFKNDLEILTLDTFILEREGKTEDARNKAEYILTELEGSRANNMQSAITFCTFTAVMAELKRIRTAR